MCVDLERKTKTINVFHYRQQAVFCAPSHHIRNVRATGGDDVLRNIEADIIQPGQSPTINKQDAVVETKKDVATVNAAEGGTGGSGGSDAAGGSDLTSKLTGFFGQFLNTAKDQAQKSVVDDLAKVSCTYHAIN